MLLISFEWFKFAFEWLESFSNKKNLHSKLLESLRMVRMCIRMVRIPFKRLEFAFKWLELHVLLALFWGKMCPLHSSLVQDICYITNSNHSNANSNHSKGILNGLNIIRMVRVPFEWLEFPFEWFEYHSNDSNLHSNGWNLHSNALNLVRTVRIGIRMVTCS